MKGINEHLSLYNDYEELMIKYEKKEVELRKTKYEKKMVELKAERLEEELAEKDIEIEQLKEELIKEKFLSAKLEAKLNNDGTNANIPTSQTPINKKKVIPNTREKTDNPKGGQKGHKKHKLEKFEDDEVNEYVEHDEEKCPECGCENIEKVDTICKDELDFKIIPVKRRHNFNVYVCPCCGKKFHKSIPNNLKEENQYGPQIQALELTLMNQANVTINKAKKITDGITNGAINLSEGYLAKLQKRAANNLNKFMEDLNKQVLIQKIVYWDDTVIMTDTNRSCLRFYGNEKLALYTAHEHKNKAGFDDDMILNRLSKDTIVEHDHNKVNYNSDYSFTNAECNRHLLSDLKKVTDILGHSWAKRLTDFLTKTNKSKEWRQKKNINEFSPEELEKINNKFMEIMDKACKENNEENKKRYYVSEEATLITRILDYNEQYLLWVYDFDVPFTNNLSERSLRGVKSKQKASGQFQNIDSAKNYATIKSYIETCNRNKVNIYNALLKLCIGTPYTLNEILNGNV